MARYIRGASDAAMWASRGLAAIVIAGGLTALATGSALVISLHGAGATQSTEASVPEVAEFQKRAQEYVALHKKIEGGHHASSQRSDTRAD